MLCICRFSEAKNYLLVFVLDLLSTSPSLTIFVKEIDSISILFSHIGGFTRHSLGLSVAAYNNMANKAVLNNTHVILDVDVVHSLVVELLLHVGDGGVVPRDAVDPCVLQTPILHQLTAHLHDQGNKLQGTETVAGGRRRSGY